MPDYRVAFLGRFFRLVVFCLLYLQSLFWSVSRVFAYTVYDDFLTIDSLGNYTAFANGGTVIVQDGLLKLSAPSGRTFPYVILNNLTLGDNFSIEMRFRYPSAGGFGLGTVLSETLPANGSFYDSYALSTIYTWRDVGGLWVGYPNNFGGKEVLRYTDFNFHLLKFEKVGNRYYSYFDGILKSDTEVSKDVNYVWFGNSHRTNTVGTWSTIEIDYLSITSDDPGPEFVYYGQGDSPWGEQEYDRASEWASPGETTMRRWGCATTSAAMIFRHFGVNTPDNMEPTPGNLNSWLIGQPDGYVRNGLLNWLALARMSRQSEEAGYSPTSLEFAKKKSFDDEALEYPTILGMPGHFLVARESEGENFLVSDPADSSIASIPKSSDFLSANTYTPSHTDLSYIMAVIDPGVTITLLDPEGNEVGTTTLEYLVDDEGDAVGEDLQILLLEKPVDGKYTLLVENDGDETSEYDIDWYFYDSNGEVFLPSQEFLQTIIPGAVDEYEFEFIADTLNPIVPRITHASLLELIVQLREQDMIKNDGVAQALSNFVVYAQRFAEKFPWASEKMMQLAEKYVYRHRGQLIDGDAAQLLIDRF